MKLWIRAETRENEHRTPLIPEHAAALISQGVTVTVESSAKRIYPDQTYQEVGCHITKTNYESAPSNCYILGLKELPNKAKNYSHSHIYYGDLFERTSEMGTLTEFKNQGGCLYDYEYMLGPDNTSVITMSHWAGICGVTVALSVIAKTPLPVYFESLNALKNFISGLILSPIKILLIGTGKVANGAKEIMRLLNFNYDVGREIKQSYDLILNCSSLRKHSSPLLTKESLNQITHPLLIVDIGIYKINPSGDLITYVKEVLNTLDIQNGAAHTEIRLTDQGFYLIETGARLAGAIDASALTEAQGYNQLSILVESILEPKRFMQRTPSSSKYVRYSYFTPSRAGILTSDPSLKELAKIPSFHSVYCSLREGDLVKVANFISDITSYAYLVNDNLNQLEKDYALFKQIEKKVLSLKTVE